MSEQRSEDDGLWDQAIGAGGPPPLPSRRPQRRLRRRKKATWRAVAGYGALILVCLCLGAIAFLVVAAPVDGLRDRLTAQITERTGRTVNVAGGTSISLFPRPSVVLADVSLDDPGGPALSIPALEVELEAWPLMTGRIVAKRVTVRRPVVELLVDAEGRRSWDMKSIGTDGRAPSAGVAAAQSDGAPKVAPASQARKVRIGFSELVVHDATIRYRNARTQALYELTSMSLSATADEAAGFIAFEGSADWNNERVKLAGKAAPLLRPIRGESAPLAVKVSGKHVEASYDGSILLAGGFALDGRVALKSPSAGAALAWLGQPDVGDWGPLALSAKVALADARLSLSDIDGSFGGATVQGSLRVETGAERPVITAKLAVSEFGLDRPQARATPPAPEKELEGSQLPPEAAKRRAPEGGRGAVRQGRKGWREEPIDLAHLRKADADIALSLGRVAYKDVRLGPGRFTLALKGGFAQLTLDALELYGGRAQGLVTLDASGDVPVFGANLKLTDVAMLAFAGDALDFGWLDGRGDVALEIAGQGRSEREIVDALNGRLNLRVADGSMIGADVGKIVGNVQQGRFIGLSPSPGDRTPFSELAASLKIANGVATSRDMRLVSTHLNLDGEGTFALGERQMDCELRAKISGGKRGEGAGISVGSLELPVTIRGPWERPTYGIKGQEQLMEAVRTVGKRLKSPDVQDTIKGLLGSDKEERAKSRAKARELLENFLKKE